VVGQHAVVGQRDVFLLPLFIQRAATPLPEDALRRGKNPRMEKTGELTKPGVRARAELHSSQRSAAKQGPRRQAETEQSRTAGGHR